MIEALICIALIIWLWPLLLVLSALLITVCTIAAVFYFIPLPIIGLVIAAGYLVQAVLTGVKK